MDPVANTPTADVKPPTPKSQGSFSKILMIILIIIGVVIGYLIGNYAGAHKKYSIFAVPTPIPTIAPTAMPTPEQTVCTKDNGCKLRTPKSGYSCGQNGVFEVNGAHWCTCSSTCDVLMN